MNDTPKGPLGLWPGLIADPKHGPFPALLLTLTFTSGVVDAVSILSLGRVFVANMTGNVVFIGFALVGAHGFSLAASLFAMAGFFLGAFAGGAAARRLRLNRLELLRNAVGAELTLFVAALVVALIVGQPISSPGADGLAVVLASSLGVQNAVVRHLKVPDLTTTVLTMTLTGIAADMRVGDHTVMGRRLLAVGAMLAGAVCGALLVLHVSPAAGLALDVVVLAVALIAIIALARSPAGWHT
jgi:uncharacterized membrane protein YoaK (UPF0700 family)